MAKDWRISVCTRYRPVTILALVIIVFISFMMIGKAVNRQQRKIWNSKLNEVKVDMARSRLIEILGEPQRTGRTGTDKLQWVPYTSSEELGRIKREHKELVAYFYDIKIFGSHPAGFQVYLDENEEKTLSRPFTQFSFWEGRPSKLEYIFFLSLLIGTVVVWLCFRSWCKKQMRKPGPEFSPPSQSGT
jgi:hypothetical protein